MRVDFRWISAVLTACVIAGCGKPPEATFVYNEPTLELIPQARKPVEAAVLEFFGTPQKLVAWKKLPVDYGEPTGPSGSVADAKVTETSFRAEFPEELAPSLQLPGKPLLWLSGPNAGKRAEIASYDAGNGTLTLAAKLPSPPSPHDEFLIVEADAGWNLKEGRNLYMRHCVHCHGTSGDGNGPTAEYLNPLPRDYRLGVFKFTSTAAGMKACREDLKRTLQEGIPGTSMPSFVLLADAELDSLVEYVRWLAMRGEFERSLAAELSGDYSQKAFAQRKKDGESSDEIIAELRENYLVEVTDPKSKRKEYRISPTVIADVADNLASEWSTPEEEGSIVVPGIARISPEEDPHSIARGRALYMSEKAKCFSCHGAGGKGDGVSTVDYWTIPNSTPEKKFAVRGLHDQWGHPQRPRDLTTGIYRGGRRPIDIYRRIYAGIKGTQMSAFGGTVLNDQEMWDLVNYVLSIPYNPEPPPAAVLQAAGN